MGSDRRHRARLGWSLLWLVALACLVPSCALVRYSPVENVPDPSLGPMTRGQEILEDLERSGDLVLEGLARGLSELPDLGDGISARETTALGKITVWARQASRGERTWLLAEADRSKGAGGYSAALEGLLWMAEKGVIGPGARVPDPEMPIRQAWKDLPARYPDPRAVLDYLAGHYTYQLDVTSARRLQEFFRTKTGDCTEFSLLAGELLRRLGYPVLVLTVRSTRLVNHVAVIFRDQEGFWLMDASRVAVSRVLRKKRQGSGFWGPVDAYFWGLVGEFDGLAGPKALPEELVDWYARSSDSAIPFRLLSYEEYRSHIQAHGREDPEWYRFDRKR